MGRCMISFLKINFLDFSLYVFQQKIATLDALKAKGIVDNSIDIPCVFYLNYDESCDHLFISCSFANSAWTDFYHWLGVDSVRAVILLNMDAFLKRSNGGDGSICFGFQSCGLYGLQGIIQFLMAWQQIAVWFC
jgi:hypothetical protein